MATKKTEETATVSKRKYAQDEYISCRSTTVGELICIGPKTHMAYSWANAGDSTLVEYGDLLAMRSTRSKFLSNPLFIIEDEELISQWPELRPLYDKLSENSIEELMSLTAGKLKARLKNAPEGIKQAIKDNAAAMIIAGKMDSISKIKAIDEVLGTSLMSLVG